MKHEPIEAAIAPRSRALETMKPSELLYCALLDLRSIQWDKRYHVNMDVWVQNHPEHDEDQTTACEVCLAGAMMVRSLGIKEDVHNNFVEDHPLRPQFEALDSFRLGNVNEALHTLGHDPIPLMDQVHWSISEYHTGPDEFFYDMMQIVKLLRNAGL